VDTYATIDTRALAHNLGVARSHAPGCRVTAVVKADGYGHGLETAARALTAADGYAVARLSEALRLREAGLAHPILLLEGAFSAEELAIALKYHLDIVVHRVEQIELLERCGQAGHVNVWLKVDTGMGRLGIGIDQWSGCIQRLGRCPIVAQPVRAMTHLACADDTLSHVTAEQWANFKALPQVGDRDISICNSAGVVLWPDIVSMPTTGSHWIRPGLMLYGVSPTPEKSAADLGLKPVMRFASRVISVQDVKQGQAVGYGGTWKAARDSVIAVAAVGYGDGYPWPGSGLPVVVNGERAATVGRVSMDMLSIDVTAIRRPQLGDEVVLWGDRLPVEEVAAAAATIPYALLCNVTQRVRREVI
jgi:alanine racemase